MDGTAMPPTGVHFNGSVNLPDAETVMREIAVRVPVGVLRIPDGEPGDRGNWIMFQMQKFQRMPTLVPAAVGLAVGDYGQRPQLRLADGVGPGEVEWPDLGYAEAYLDSWAVFSRLRDDGVIPAGVRFQVEYPTPTAPISFVVADQQETLLESYAAALFADLGRLLAAIPHDQVAVQWDVAVEFAILEGGIPGVGPQSLGAIVARLARCIERVPEEVPAGLHLRYGDAGHQHFKQPESLALQIRVLNEVTAAARRPVSFASFTVPQNERGSAYFGPLRELQASPETELYFALVPYHPADQPPGTTAEQVRLIDTCLPGASDGAREWGICTECGMGRAERAEIAALLDLHREILGSR